MALRASCSTSFASLVKHHQELWYIGSQIVEVDNRLCAIHPPNEIQRTPRSISQTVKYWKGNFVDIIV